MVEEQLVHWAHAGILKQKQTQSVGAWATTYTCMTKVFVKDDLLGLYRKKPNYQISSDIKYWDNIGGS